MKSAYYVRASFVHGETNAMRAVMTVRPEQYTIYESWLRQVDTAKHDKLHGGLKLHMVIAWEQIDCPEQPRGGAESPLSFSVVLKDAVAQILHVSTDEGANAPLSLVF